LIAEHHDVDAVQHEALRDIPAIARQIRDRVRESERLIILTHANPDADAVSSALGMAAICATIGVEPWMVTSGDAALPANLEFIPNAQRVTVLDPALIATADLIIFVDCSDEKRLGPLYASHGEELERARNTINIDHHVTNTRFGALNLVVPSAAATAEIITEMFEALSIGVDRDCATTLLAGIYGDTLGLRTPSTTPATMRAAATLVEQGADLDVIVDQLFRLKPYSSVQLWAAALQQTKWTGPLIWTQIDQEMLDRAGATRAEAEGLVNFLAGTIGARASALLYLEPWGWRVSMRTLADDVDVARILSRFNGGGHPRAAGARLDPGDASRDEFLTAVAKALTVDDVSAPAINGNSDGYRD